VNFFNGDVTKMAKSAKKKAKKAIFAKKSKKMTAGQTKAAEYVSNLLKLHKLQGTLLARLKKEI
jgi:hypothetical protein